LAINQLDFKCNAGESNEYKKGNKLAIAIISLFGIDSISMLHERIKDAYLFFYLFFLIFSPETKI